MADVNDRRLTCEEVEEMLPEYALGALSAAEAAAVARHLRGCLQHAASLEGYEAVCDAWCASVPQANPPAKLRARLLARISAPARSPRPAGRSVRVAWALTALAAVAAIVFGVWGLSLRQQIDRQAAVREQFLAISTQPDAHMIALETEAAGQPAKGVLIYSGAQAAIWVVGLPPLQGDQVYQCWWIDRNNQRVRGASFRPEGGSAIWLVPMPGDEGDFHAIGVTLEPNDGNLEPQGPRVMSGEF
jgi:anti-sigma-K factor RskA